MSDTGSLYLNRQCPGVGTSSVCETTTHSHHFYHLLISFSFFWFVCLWLVKDFCAKHLVVVSHCSLFSLCVCLLVSFSEPLRVQTLYSGLETKFLALTSLNLTLTVISRP